MMTERRRSRRDLLAINLSAESYDEFGPTADEIIRRATTEFAEEMSQIMASPASVQVGRQPGERASRSAPVRAR